MLRCAGTFPQSPAAAAAAASVAATVAALASTANKNGGYVILGRFSVVIHDKLCSICLFWDVYPYFVLYRWRSWKAVAFQFFVKIKNTKTSGVCIIRLFSRAKMANANK